MPEVVPAPVITETKSNNIPLTTFEETRRLVDRDPKKFIDANAASIEDAEGFFIRGRAFMLVGKMWEAKRDFNEAKNRLSAVPPDNAKTIANEIAMGLAIIETPGAAEDFAKQIAALNPVDANSNTNVNAAGNANVSNANAVNSANVANAAAPTR